MARHRWPIRCALSATLFGVCPPLQAQEAAADRAAAARGFPASSGDLASDAATLKTIDIVK